MDDRKNPNRAEEFKRLLERLERMTPAPCDAAGPRLDGDGSRTPPPLRTQQAPTHRSLAHELPIPPIDWQRPRRDPGISMWMFVLATALNTVIAAVLAVFITLQAMQPDATGVGDDSPQRVTTVRNSFELDAVPDVTASVPIPPQAGPAAASVHLPPIGSPEAPLRLEPQRPSPFPLRIEPQEARGDTYILVLSGLPAGSQLTGAERIGSDTWLLTTDSTASLQLAIPEWSTAVQEVGVELRRTNGAEAATTKAWLLVAPPAQPQPRPTVDEAAVQQLVERSRLFLARGDIAAARTLYERAADMGNSEAAFMLASTYDPNRLWALGVFGMVGNKERAKQWYQRADQLGHPEAKDRMRLLGD